MRNIFICSAFQGLESNLVLARKYCKYVLENEKAVNVFAPHLFFPQFLDESNQADRQLGISLGIDTLSRCNEMWILVVNGVITDGMSQEICKAMHDEIPRVYFDSSDPDNIIRLRHINDFLGVTHAQLLAPVPFSKAAANAFDSISAALKAGIRYEDLEGSLESFLGPLDAVQEQDTEADKAWEVEYRNANN